MRKNERQETNEVQAEIRVVEEQINNTEQELKNIMMQPPEARDQDYLRYLRNEEAQLRDKEAQLRDEKARKEQHSLLDNKVFFFTKERNSETSDKREFWQLLCPLDILPRGMERDGISNGRTCLQLAETTRVS